MHELDFSGRTALIVGGSSGIGNGIARAFRDRSAKVHICGTRAQASDYAGEAGTDLEGMHYSKLDVADDDAVANFDLPGDSLDVLVCAQGLSLFKRAEFEIANFRQVMDVNLISVMALCTRFQPMLAKAKGSVVLVNSTGAFKASIGNPAYGASKGGMRVLTMTLAEAWAPDIRVNAIAPGFVETRLTRVTRDHPRRYEDTLRNIPLKRWGTPDEMGGVALFLASPLANYITGQTVIVDGGKSLSGPL
jgi:3-oxoacyl-[acyl-carrier protein] reductase